MSADEPVDTGFGDVLAGEVYVHPDVTAADRAEVQVLDPPVTATVIPEQAPEPAEVSPPDPAALPNTDTGLTAAGVQAAKALVHLPALTWPELSKLARELAMDIKEEHVILKEFKLDNAQFEYLKAYNDFFREAFAAACKEWHAPLSTQDRIKVEAAAILEDSLLGLGARMQNKGEGLPGVIEAAKLFAKVAGVGERADGGAAPGERFSINIDLGGDTKITVRATASQGAPVQPAVDNPLLSNTSPG